MYKQTLTFILITTILLTNSVFAIEKKIAENPTINTTKNIQQAQLIEKEVTVFKRKLLSISQDYLIEKTPLIQESVKDLEEIIYILKKIQTPKINKATADNVLKIVINDLKTINTNTKNYLKSVKSSFTIQNQKYSQLAEKLSLKLDMIISVLVKHYNKKTSLSDKDRKTIKIMRSLEKKSKKLKKFKDINFNNIEEVKSSIVRSLRAIREDIVDIKRSLQ